MAARGTSWARQPATLLVSAASTRSASWTMLDGWLRPGCRCLPGGVQPLSLVTTSPAKPDLVLSAHDLTVAGSPGPDPRPDRGWVMLLADRGHQGARGTVRVMFRARNLPAGPTAVNTAHVRLRAPGEPAVELAPAPHDPQLPTSRHRPGSSGPDSWKPPPDHEVGNGLTAIPAELTQRPTCRSTRSSR